jgi:hypothetical protein
MRPTTLARLRAISDHENRAEWKVIEDALHLYFGQMPAETRRAVERTAKRPETK